MQQGLSSGDLLLGKRVSKDSCGESSGCLVNWFLIAGSPGKSAVVLRYGWGMCEGPGGDALAANGRQGCGCGPRTLVLRGRQRDTDGLSALPVSITPILAVRRFHGYFQAVYQQVWVRILRGWVLPARLERATSRLRTRPAAQRFCGSAEASGSIPHRSPRGTARTETRKSQPKARSRRQPWRRTDRGRHGSACCLSMASWFSPLAAWSSPRWRP
jgi:hypothetical protein